MMQPYDLYSTYSIAACDLDAGELGAAVQTHQIGVGSRILWLEPEVGALVTPVAGEHRLRAGWAGDAGGGCRS